MAQKRMIMHISYITEPLSAALRTLFATLVLLVFPMGMWGDEVNRNHILAPILVLVGL